MKENNEENCSSNSSAISENGEFYKLSLDNSNKSDEENDSTKKVNNYSYKDKEENKKSYNSMFSFIFVKNEDKNSDIKVKKQNNILIENKYPQLEIRVSDNNNISLWEAIKQQISNYKNQLIFNYNIFSGLNNLNVNDPRLPNEIQIFEKLWGPNFLLALIFLQVI